MNSNKKIRNYIHILFIYVELQREVMNYFTGPYFSRAQLDTLNGTTTAVMNEQRNIKTTDYHYHNKTDTSMHTTFISCG